MKLEVFDPPMCCGSGECGPEPDDHLIEFADLLDEVAGHGVTVERYNPSTHPQVFTTHDLARRYIAEEGIIALPLMLLEGKLLMKGKYPTREELLSALGLPAAP